MTATTPIYGLSYPEGTDLVSSAPDSFKAMADTFETALDTVDRRSTPAGATPVIATTLETLKTQKRPLARPASSPRTATTPARTSGTGPAGITHTGTPPMTKPKQRSSTNQAGNANT